MKRDHGSSGDAEVVGVRRRSEVLSALDAVTGDQGAEAARISSGKAAVYEWALGRTESSPVTARGGRGVPDLAVLTAELDAVTVQLEAANTDYLRGLRDALTWLCGYEGEPG